MNLSRDLPRRVAIATVLMAVAVVLTASEMYKLSNVKRVEQDLYRSGNFYILTRYCYHYAYGETAILKGGKIIWEDDSTCDVKEVFKK